MTARLLETYDVLMVLAPLIEARPWQSESGGKLRRFVQGQWNLVGEAEARKMHRCEAQAWLAVYNLLVDGSVRSKYALTSFRRNQLLRLRGFLNEATVDQIPVLTELQRAMDELQLMDSSQVQSQKPAYVLEQLPELRDMLSRGVNWAEVAAAQLKDALNDSDEDKRKQALRRPPHAVQYEAATCVLVCCAVLCCAVLCCRLQPRAPRLLPPHVPRRRRSPRCSTWTVSTRSSTAAPKQRPSSATSSSSRSGTPTAMRCSSLRVRARRACRSTTRWPSRSRPT